MKFNRVYSKPKSSILMLGPRGTGKSTFIRDEIKPELTIDLLKSTNFRTLSINPSELESMVGHLKPKQMVLIDEVQKIPELLDEVQRLIEEKKLIFILTGSSARKLRKQGANLLAGRALRRKMYPLSLKELAGYKKISEHLMSGSLPTAINLDEESEVNEYLFSYVETYLKEEIFQEGLTRSLNDFSRFIEIAGQYHGQILNFENISRKVKKSGDTVKSWFQILQDTLLAQPLEAYSFNSFPNETKHQKFYFFDAGVARAAEGIKDLSHFPEKKGFYLESLILNELNVYAEVHQSEIKIFYFNVPSIGDVDFVIEIRKKSISSPSKVITLEVKHSKNWNTEFNKMSLHLLERNPKQVERMLGVYLGDQRLTKNKVEIYPLESFVESLWRGDFF